MVSLKPGTGFLSPLLPYAKCVRQAQYDQQNL